MPRQVVANHLGLAACAALIFAFVQSSVVFSGLCIFRGECWVDTGLASFCVGFGVQAAYRRLADISRFAPRRPSFVKRHKRRQKGLAP
ncbi:hypothetical protein ACSVIJ_09150, partial [Pseudomonas sp. NCHU5208]|uniref:hypothetical protein n=1 Tax=unclassified Pseudomonas TaxID=196821 RepID=UPI003F992D0A